MVDGLFMVKMMRKMYGRKMRQWYVFCYFVDYSSETRKGKNEATYKSEIKGEPVMDSLHHSSLIASLSYPWYIMSKSYIMNMF